MRNLLRANNFSVPERQRLEYSGAVSKHFTTDVNYIRLRQYFAASSVSTKPLLIADEYPSPSKADVQKYLTASPILLQRSAIVELLRLPPTKVTSEIIHQSIQPIRHPSMSEPSSHFYNTHEPVYSGEDLYKVVVVLMEKRKNGMKSMTYRDLNHTKLLRGLGIRHPEGEAGESRSTADYLKECATILNGCTQSQTPTAEDTPALTYDNMEYSKINWRMVFGHENFEYLRALKDCGDSTHAINYALNQHAVSLKEYAERANASGRHSSASASTSTENTQQPAVSHDSPKVSTIYQAIKHVLSTNEVAVKNADGTAVKNADGTPCTKTLPAELRVAYNVLRANRLTQNPDIKAEAAEVAEAMVSFGKYNSEEYLAQTLMTVSSIPWVIGANFVLDNKSEGYKKFVNDVVNPFATKYRGKSDTDTSYSQFTSSMIAHGVNDMVCVAGNSIGHMLKLFCKYLDDIKFNQDNYKSM